MRRLGFIVILVLVFGSTTAPAEERRWSVQTGIGFMADPDAFLERYKFHVAPATDNRPYFFHFFR